MISKISILLLLLISLGGCTEAKIDTSTKEKMKDSIQSVKSSLPIEKQKEFETSIKILMFSRLDMKSILANTIKGNPIDKDNSLNNIKELLNGKTGLEVIALSQEFIEKRKLEKEKRKLERYETKKKDELLELESLRNKKISYAKNKKELSKFKIISSSFKKNKKNEYTAIKQSTINLKVKNETTFPISRAYFKGTIKSKERSIPWLVETFNYKIAGGIEPNEELAWSLRPNMFSKWNKVNIPKDAVFIVEVERLDGINEEELFSIQDFSNDDKSRLEELEKKYKE